MITKRDLGKLIIECIEQKNGRASLLEVSKYIWNNYENDLRVSGDLFYTWQYDIRWQATILRQEGKLLKSEKGGLWQLAPNK